MVLIRRELLRAMLFRKSVLIGAAITAVLLSFAPQAQAQYRKERRLAGITIGSKGLAVLRAYGNPTRVANGLGAPPADVAAAVGQTGTGTTTSPYGPYGPYGPGATGPYPPGTSGYSGPPGVSNPYMAGVMRFMSPGGTMPGVGTVPNITYGPGALPVPGASDTTSEGVAGISEEAMTDFSVPTEPLVTWTYEIPKAKVTLDFRLDEDGRVVEIVGTGRKPTSLVKTSVGVTLGDPYGKVLRLYGPPDRQFQQVVPGLGTVTTVSYHKKYGVAFQLQNMKVVRIVVAEVK